jgi:HSP20 family protein
MSTSLFAPLREPFERLLRLQEELGRALEHPLQTFSALSGAGVFPQANVFNTPEGCVVRLEVPGMTPQSLRLEVAGNVVRISGKRDQTQRGSFHRRERWAGEFARSFQLPQDLEPAKAEASYRHGLLTIRVPRREEAKPRQITVHAS